MADLALTARLPHLPNDLIYASLYENVQNAAFLRQQLIDCNTDFEFAFIDASTILSTKHLLAACFRAINDAAHARLRSRNVHSEIVFALNPSNNIAESFRRFGVQTTTTALLAIKILHLPPAAAADQPRTSDALSNDNNSQAAAAAAAAAAIAPIAAHLQTHIRGIQLACTDAQLARLADLQRIRKVYKAPAPPAVAAAASKTSATSESTTSSEARLVQLEAVVLGAMAIKGS